ncbi:MAG: hypothetical protein PHS48_11090, partial [Bacteroidales bacterium]|nr:hypothetical protein [Bacteroidales bacterium]
DVDTITFTTDGDVPWKIYTRNNALGVQTEVVGTGPVFPGQRSTLYGTFTLQEEGIFAYKQYYRYRYSPYEWQLYDQAGKEVATNENENYLGNNWYRFTMTLGNGNPLPPGTYTMVWSIDIPLLALNYRDDASYHSCFLDDFSVGSMTAPLTVLCNPPEGGKTYVDGVEGSSFNKFIGQNVTLQVTENETYLFQKWQDSNTNEWYRNIVIKDPELDGVNANTYTANFVQAAFVMAVAQPGEGGSVSGGYQKYALGSEVYLNAYPNTGWRFDRWSDDDQLPETDPIPANRSFTCTAEHHNQTFTAQFVRCITVTGQALYPNLNNPGWWYSGGGTITGTGTYDVGDPATPVLVTLTATPTNENFAFLGWDDNNNRIIDPEESTAPTRELSLTWADTKNFHAIALFQQTALVIVNYYQQGDDALGEITITSGEAVLPLEDFLEGRRLPVGTVLNLTGTANEHCRFNNWWQNWYGSNNTVAGNPLQITVSPENVNTYYADFAQLVPVEVVFAPGTPAGCSAQVLLNGVDQGLYSWQEIGAALELRASCPANYRAQWEGTNFHTIYIFVNADPLENVYPVEFIPTYSVHLATSPDPCPGGYVTPVSQTIDLGTESSFYAGTNWGEYWRFVRWSDAVTDSSRTFNPAESGTYSFTALFERYVTIACQGESSNYGYHYSDFDGDGDLAVTDVPRQVTVTALPGDGFRFDRWTDDAAASLPDATNPVRVFNVSTADTYIGLKANFVKTQLVTVGVKPGCEAWGTISTGALDNAPVDYGTEITFTATANPNCQFLGWTDYSTEATRTETVSYDVTYLAEFASQAPVNIRIQEGQEGWGCQAGIVGP